MLPNQRHERQNGECQKPSISALLQGQLSEVSLSSWGVSIPINSLLASKLIPLLSPCGVFGQTAHFLGVAASWVVQVGVDIYKTLSHLFNTKEELDEVDKRKEFELLGRKIISATIRCTASLVFAAIGAGLGASLVRPSLGQWLGMNTIHHQVNCTPLLKKGTKHYSPSS